MSISENDIKTYEDRYKSLVYEKVREIISKQTELITNLEKNGKYFDIDTDVPNVGITFNNKLVELAQIFKKAGISMFVDPNEKYDFVGSNFVGDAIIEDMISQLSNGMQVLSECNSSMSKATTEKSKKVKALEESSTIKKLFFKIRSFFVTNTVLDSTSFSEAEIGEVKSHLSKYKEVDKNLCEYNLRDNVVQSLVNFINNREYHDFTIPELLEESVISTLQKLGLEDVIPNLQEELSKTQEELNSSNKKSWKLSETQKLGIQMSSERLADGVKQKESNTTQIQDKEYID